MSENDDRRAAGSALVVLRSRVDDHFSHAFARSRGAMQCADGCESCCHVRLSVFGIEADRIRQALRDLGASDPDLRSRVRQRADDHNWADRCPLLVDGRCAIYEERPLICRSHGLPIAVTADDGTVDVDHCRLNFQDAPFDPESVINLEAINRPLAVMARLWGTGERVELETLAREVEPLPEEPLPGPT